ncbi:MAG: DinB family protein [Deltaproteobacteria bacterium]|nr:DinB family protein [Deltaproteobacteria bacterium]
MMNVVEEIKEGLRRIFQDQHNRWREVVTGLDAAALNWKPGEDTNSLAALVAHTCDAERFLMATALGITIDREREAKFRTVVTGTDELLKLIDETEAETDGYIDRLNNDMLVAEHSLPGRTQTGIWWALHGIEHSTEHIGQALLTRQMYDQRS